VSAHTPWVVRSPKNDSRALDVYNAMGTKIHHGYWGGAHVAHLIAAAPSLLSFAEEYVRWAEETNMNFDDDGTRGLVETARAVIARAKGERL
jgi:hypothetical protein